MYEFKRILSAPQAIKTLISGQATLYESDDDDWNYLGLVLIKLQKELYRTKYSYFVRAIDISDGNNKTEPVLNHEIHIPFIIKRRKKFFIYFPTAYCHVGLSFLDEEIADDFLNMIKEINSYEKEQIESCKLNESFFSSPPKRDANKYGIKSSSGRTKALAICAAPASNYENVKKEKKEKKTEIIMLPKSIPDNENDLEDDDDDDNEKSECESDDSSESIEKRAKFKKAKKYSDSENEEIPIKKESCLKKTKEQKESATEINEKKSRKESKEKSKSKVPKKEISKEKEEADQSTKVSEKVIINEKEETKYPKKETKIDQKIAHDSGSLVNSTIDNKLSPPPRLDLLNSIKNASISTLKKIEPNECKPIAEGPNKMKDQLSNALLNFEIAKKPDSNEKESDDEFK